MLLITPDLCLKFMMQIEKGAVSLTNTEPPISKVLDGTCSYQCVKSNAEELGHSKANKYLNALQQLYEQQSMILNKDNGATDGVKRLRDVEAIKQFEQNVQSKASSRKNK